MTAPHGAASPRATESGVRLLGGEDPLARLFLLAALGIGLGHFFRLGAWSLWLDEALTLADSRRPWQQANPLGYALMGAFLGLFEGRPDEFLLRLPSAALGWLGIPLTWWAFRPVAGRRVAAAAALIVACSAWHLHWSQQARFYTLAQDLSLVGAGLYLRGLRGSTGSLLAGLGLAALAALAHPSAAFLAGSLLVAPWILRGLGFPLPGLEGRGWKLLLVAGILGAAGGLGWAVDVWRKWDAVKGEGTPVHFVLTTGFYVTPLLWTGVLAGAVLAVLRRATFPALALAVAALDVGGLFATSIFARANAQYVFVALPWLAWVAATPLDPLGSAGGWGRTTEVARLGSRLKLAYLALLALPALASCVLYLGPRQGERPRWKDAYRHVYGRLERGDLILGMEAVVGEYYLAPGRRDLRDLRQLVWLDSWRSDRPGAWARHARRTWLVVNHEQLQDWEADEREELQEILRRDCRVVAYFPVRVESRDLDVWVYLRE